MNYRINGGRTHRVLVSEWRGGERYGDDSDVYYAEYRGTVRGADPGDSVEVWFNAIELRRGFVESEHFTYTQHSDSGAQALVVADEDYTGVNPTYPAGTDAPKYTGVYAAAIDANGGSNATFDMDAQGVPHPLGVLGHFDAVIWELGDNRLTQDEEDFITEHPLAFTQEDLSVAEREHYLTLAARDYLNEGGKLVHDGETTGYFGLLGSSLGGIYYGLDGAPEEDCVVSEDPFSDCLLLADDFVQYYLGAYSRTPVGGAAGVIGTDVANAAQVVSNWGFTVTPEVLTATAADIGENSILSRAGGAPTLAVGIAQIFDAALPGEGMMAFWYHFAILFEALFILTAVDAGTRAGRFMLQDLLGSFVPVMRRTESWGPNLIATAGCVALWGYFLYVGVTDPLGGINMLWPLFGIANQMLAGIALMLCTVVLFKMKKDRYAWVPALPTLWLLACTLSAGWIKLFSADPGVGFLAQANRYRAAINAGELIAPSKDFGGMQQIMFNNYVNAGLTALFLLVVMSVLFYSIVAIRRARASAVRTDRETPYVALTPEQQTMYL